MRRAFLAENNPILYDDMVLTETLFLHSWEIDEAAHRRVKQIMTDFLEKNLAPDKATQQLARAMDLKIRKIASGYSLAVLAIETLPSISPSTNTTI